MTPGSQRLRRVVTWLWIMGFTVGSLSHLWDVLDGGSRAYDGYSWPIRGFWFSLTLVDPAIVALLWLQRRSGVILAALTMAIDFAVGLSVSLPLAGGVVPGGLIRLAIFTALVLCTAPMLWRRYSPDSQ